MKAPGIEKGMERPRALALLGFQRTPPIAFAAVLVIGALVPFVLTNTYILGVGVLILIYSILNLGWNLTIGICGIWNFGQLALFAMGGYAYGIIAIRLGWPSWAALAVGAVFGAAAGVLMIIPALRLKGIYAALLTFSFAEVFRLVVINDDTGLTGGPYGLSSVPNLFPGRSALGVQRGYFWLALVLCVAAAWALKRLMDSPTGMALLALRDSTPYAIGMGVNRRTSVVLSTAISGLLAGLAGALYAGYYQGISPVVMGLAPMSLFVLMIVVGGLGTIFGPALGTTVVMVLTELLRDVEQWRFIVLGAILLAILALQPTGLSGLLVRAIRGVQAWMIQGDRPGAGASDEADEVSDEAQTRGMERPAEQGGTRS